MIILRLLLLLTNLHLKLLSTQGTGADKLLSTQRVNKPARVLAPNNSLIVPIIQQLIVPTIQQLIVVYNPTMIVNNIGTDL